MTAFLVGITLLVAAAAACALAARRGGADRVYGVLVAVGSAVAAAPAVRVLATGEPLSMRWHGGLPGGDWVLGIDPLSAIFLLAILGVGVASALYGVAYLAPEKGHRATWFAHAAFALLLSAMALVVTAQSALFFLCAWELMAVGSYVMIVTEHEHAAVRRAGLLYLVVTHAGTLALFAMFAVWGRGSTDLTFASLAAAPLHTAGASAVFALALFGFGVKAGFIPLHFWLPPAHAASPSHVSALMSGVVIKLGIYGILRVVLLAGAPPLWWGWTVLVLGTVSALFGVLWALVQHDVKRLLAYHSVENIGIILLGAGAGGLAAAYGHPALAALGYAAAALHTVNHALFKSLLFLGAGAVYRATGTRNLEELGGLARRMPVTWLAFVIGAAAIIGVPPLNGFVSEWLVYQALFRAGLSAESFRLAVLAVPVLALVGGLALACFAKVAGIGFLGEPRTPAARDATDAAAGMRGPMLALAAACTVIGVAPALFVGPALLVGAHVAGADWPAAAEALAGVVDGAQRISFVAVGVGGVGALLWLARAWVVTRRRVRTAPTWGCGYAAPSPQMQYTASSFAEPLVTVFGRSAGVHEHRGATVFHSVPVDLVLDGLALPLWARIERLALRLRPMQQGRLHVYLLYIVATLVVLLVYLVAAGRP